MDFVTAWKATSIVLTGAFGVLGLLKDFKNKDTGRVTKWGQVSLAGILLSSGLGIIAQLKESSNQERSREEAANQTLKTVKDIQRILSPLDDPHFWFEFEVPCNDPKYEALCLNAEAPNSPSMHSAWAAKWPPGPGAILTFSIDFFVDAKDAQEFLAGRSEKSDLGVDVTATNLMKDKPLDVWREPGSKIVLLVIHNYVPNTIDSSGAIKSTLDLPGTTMILSNLDSELSGFKLKTFDIKLKNGQEINTQPERFERITKGNAPAYRYVFPCPEEQLPNTSQSRCVSPKS